MKCRWLCPTLSLLGFVLTSGAQPAPDMHVPRYQERGTNYAPYPLLANDTLNLSFSTNTLNLLANNFCAMYEAGSNLGKSDADYLYWVNTNYQITSYINDSRTGTMYSYTLADIEQNHKNDLLYYLAGNLGSALSATNSGATNGLTITNLFGTLVASTAAAGSNITYESGGIYYYVTWLKVDDELMRIEAVTNDAPNKVATLTVTRGFSGSTAAAHANNAPVLAPAYAIEPTVGMAQAVSYYNDPGATLMRQDLWRFTENQYTNRHRGIWMDILADDFNCVTMGGEAMKTTQEWDSQKDQIYDQHDWESNAEAGINFVQTNFHAVYGFYPALWGNNLSWPLATNEDKVGMVLSTPEKPRPIDGFSQENGVANFATGVTDGNYTVASYANWKAHLQSTMLMGEIRVAAVFMNMDAGVQNNNFSALPDAVRHSLLLYGYATYLLGVRVETNDLIYSKFGFTALVGTNSATGHYQLDPVFLYRVGRPAETRASSDYLGYKISGKNTFLRRFENGVVLANPNDNTNQTDTIPLDREYFDPETSNVVNQVQLAAKTGRILLNPGDTVPPWVAITAPTNGTVFRTNDIIGVSATVTDNVQVASVELRLDSTLWQTDTNAPFLFSLTNLAAGPHTLSVRGVDTSFNSATDSVSIVVSAPPTSGTWNTNANGNWSNAANWTNGLVPNGFGSTANIAYNISGGARTVTIDLPVSVGILNFGDTDGSTNFNLALGNGSLTFDNNGNGAQLNQLSTSAGDSFQADFTLADNLTICNFAAKFLAVSGNIDTGPGYDLTVETIGNGMNFSGVISGGGSLIKNGADALAALNGTLTNTFAGGVVVNAGTLGVHNPGGLGTGPLTLNGGALDNNNGAAVSNVNNNAQNWLRDFTFKGDGAQGADLELGTGPVTMTNGSRTLTVNSNKLTVGGPISDNGQGYGLTKNGAGTLSLGGAGLYSGNTTLSNGTLVLANAAALQNSTLGYNGGALGFGANLSVCTLGGLAGNQNLPLTNLAGALLALTVGANGSDTTYSGALSQGGSFIKTGSGLLTLSGGSLHTGGTMVSNGTLRVNGSLAGTVVVAAGATLGGTGTIKGAVTSNGTLSPGASIGTLTISNALTLGASATTLFEISRDGGGPTNDAIAGLTSIAFGGALVVTNVGTNALVVSNRFQLFSGAGTGSFASTNLPPLGFGLGWSNKLGIDGSLIVVPASTVPTAPTNLNYTLTSSNLTLWWPSNYLGWSLQAQTNPLTTGLSTNWGTVPGSDTNTALTFPLDPSLPSVFYRLFFHSP